MLENKDINLCVACTSVFCFINSQKPECIDITNIYSLRSLYSVMNCYTLLEPILNNLEAINLRTRRARGGFELHRTLGLRGDSARLAASLRSAPKTKKFSLQLLLRWRGLGRSRQIIERKILCFGSATLSSQKTLFPPCYYYTLIY